MEENFMKIKSINIINVEPTEVYDIEVPEYHNFALSNGIVVHNSKIYNVDYTKVENWQRGQAKNAVFGMIYGESEKAFADIYLNGDLVKAKEIFDGMFIGFPRIKNFIERAQEQFKRYSKVTTMTQRYINIDDPKADYNRQLRQASNYVIQGAAEDIAGLLLYQLIKYINDNNMKSKPFCFIHDSVEVDYHPDELFELLVKTREIFNNYPQEVFNVPMACDVCFGTSMGDEIVMKDISYDEKYNDVTIKLNGFIDDIDNLLNNWRLVYKVVDVVDDGKDNYEEVYISYADRFLPKKARITAYAGKTRNKGTMVVHVIRK
jgi:hypothetical protein